MDSTWARLPSYDDMWVRDTNRRHRACITAVVEVTMHLRSAKVLPQFGVGIADGDPGTADTTVRVPPGFQDSEYLARMSQVGEYEWLHPGWTHRPLNEVPSLWPGTKLFAGRLEEHWPDDLPPGVSRPDDMRWGRGLAKRFERGMADNILSSLYGHLRDDLEKEVFPLPSDVIPRAGLRHSAPSLIVRHPSTPPVGLSAPPDDDRQPPSHSDLVSDLIPPGGMIVCEEARSGLGVGARVRFRQFLRPRLKFIVDFRWAVTVPEAFRLFTAV